MKSWTNVSLCLLILSAAGAAQAQSGANSYRVVNLVSNVAGVAAVTDPGMVDPWGFSNPGTPFWLSDHGSGLSTVYAATGVANANVIVTIPAAGASGTGKPTGQVQNSAGAAFRLSNGNNASFIFASEDGLITAWNNAIGKVAEIKIDNSSKNAVYKGLAIGTSAAGGTLYGANFRSGKIDTWGAGFAPVTLAGSFADPQVPAGYAPFNIWNIGNKLYVEYAKQDKDQFLDVGGPGTGYVAVFDLNGNLITHLISGGVLNSP
ncbi:MAG TPA: TIGR03118 family protein, partial [Bryobacteraceae bacterium]|nr:TIGR03118 family protein [Bryobacteraceae bacterium]